MSNDSQAGAAVALRDQILSDPSVVLDDLSILKALLSAEAQTRGGRVVDMRGVAMSRMENRIDQLEQTHQTVISAAYYNVSTTQQVHRAILTMIAPLDFNDFLVNLDNLVADCLRIRAVRLVMEADTDHPDSDLNTLTGTLSLMAPRAVAEFRNLGRSGRSHQVLLRQVGQGDPRVYGIAAHDIRSEAVVELDMGDERAPALLVLGADDPGHFTPGQATDLLELFARVCERMLRSWLG
ncbi:MAG: DUF484 family protein [Rhodobacteraceae bacterium]|nr:DUF484 family protein [Paracoccaceae bacterium]